MSKHAFVRNAVLVFSWATVAKEQALDMIYGMGLSMEPVIPDGSVILVEKLSRRWRDWERGDVVLLRSPTRSNGATICKRILALEGDVVQLQPRFDQSRQETITVPKGHVWVEGDNPTLSVDSRHIGAVPAALVLGRARAIYGLCGRQTMSKHEQLWIRLDDRVLGGDSAQTRAFTS